MLSSSRWYLILFFSYGFPSVIAPAFSTPAFSAPPLVDQSKTVEVRIMEFSPDGSPITVFFVRDIGGIFVGIYQF